VLGTPTQECWPGWDRLPDSGKMHFDEKRPVEDWQQIGEFFGLD
jgi:hypothetical protein